MSKDKETDEAMIPKKDGRGGRREGSGRKKQGKDVVLLINVTPSTYERLKIVSKAQKKTYSDVLECGINNFENE